MTNLIHKQLIHQGGKKSFLDLIRLLTGLSEEETRLLIQKGGAYEGKFRCKTPEKLIRQGAHLQAFYRLPLTDEGIPFEKDWIIEDNKSFMVAYKPAGIPTQGRRDGDTMAFYEILKNNSQGYLGLHHRLDQGTSGLMLFSRNKQLNPMFSRLFTENFIQKSYLALCHSNWPGRNSTLLVDQPIGRDSHASPSRFKVTRSGKTALTQFELIGSDGQMLLVLALPKTGRTHQIRIHAAHQGFPLIGDNLYGTPDAEDSFFLHAFRLEWSGIGSLPGGKFSLALPDRWTRKMSAGLIDHYQNWRSAWQES